MAAVPLLEEISGGPAGVMVTELAGQAHGHELAQFELLASGRPQRRLAIYAASAGFDLVEELDQLATRTVEPNIFFHPRFLAPAMPRLEDRDVKLAVIRDGDDYRSRLRLLAPFCVERPAGSLGTPIMRTWSNPFGPLGTPLVDRDDPVCVVEDFFAMLARPHLKLPKIFVMPDMRLDGEMASLLHALAEAHNLPLIVTGETQRPFLHSDLDGETYLKASLRPHHYREYRRLWRRLGETGALQHQVARTQKEIRHAIEAFLTLEAAGWKGRKRTAMVIDRYRAPFAREAVYRMAEQDMCRIHTLTLDGKAVASLIVFLEAGCAYTWKTAYDERLAAYSPGMLLMIEVTRRMLEDPNVVMADSCAVPDHPVMSRLWAQTRPMGTIVMGLTPGTGRIAAQAASQLHLYRETRNMVRVLRNRMKGLLRRPRALG